MHSIDSRSVTGPSDILFQVCICARFSPEIVQAMTVKGLIKIIIYKNSNIDNANDKGEGELGS